MGSNSIWTSKQNKMFENALASFDKDTPDWWQNLARALGKSVEDVKCHYQKLVEDVDHIESGKVPLPNYRPYGDTGKEKKITDDQEQRYAKNQIFVPIFFLFASVITCLCMEIN